MQNRRRVGHAVRRSRPTYTPDDLLSSTLAAPLHWPGRTIRLERDSLLDYANHNTSAQVSVAELYHENSKLSPELLPELAYTAVDVRALRQEFLRRRVARANIGGDVRRILPWSVLTDEVFASTPEFFYAIELRLVADRTVFGYEPGGGLTVLSLLTSAREQELLDAIRLLDPARTERPAAVVVLLGCFARNEILLGVRGYRRTLLEAGQLAHEIVRVAARSGCAAHLRFEFADRDLDLMMEADGVEQSAVVAVELG